MKYRSSGFEARYNKSPSIISVDRHGEFDVRLSSIRYPGHSFSRQWLDKWHAFYHYHGHAPDWSVAVFTSCLHRSRSSTGLHTELNP